MVNPTSGNDIPEDLKHVYKQEFIEGANLFEQSFSQYQNSQIPAQKEAFKDVMKKAMNVMNETAKLCLSKEAQKSEAKLNDSFEEFESNQTPQSMDDLSKSIKDLKKDL
jgi:hypothetical protein